MNATSDQRQLAIRPPCTADESGLRTAEVLIPKLFHNRYGILENPVGVTPNPRYLYESRTHAEAKSGADRPRWDGQDDYTV